MKTLRWHVPDAATGSVIVRVKPNPVAHHTNDGADGKEASLAGLRSKMLAVANVRGSPDSISTTASV